jgi:hypothetical protein
MSSVNDDISSVRLTSMAGADAAQKAVEFKMEADRRESRLREESIRGEETKALLQKHIYDNANPNPVIVALCCVMIIVGLFAFYIMFMKPCATGKWHAQDGSLWIIKHNLFNNKLSVKCITRKKTDVGKSKKVIFYMNGKMRDNIFNVGDTVGLWNYSDVVLFMNGGGMQRIHEI